MCTALVPTTSQPVSAGIASFGVDLDHWWISENDSGRGKPPAVAGGLSSLGQSFEIAFANSWSRMRFSGMVSGA